MAITLQDAITKVRFRHPAFHKRHVTDASLASFFSTYQRFLVQKGVQRNREFLTAQASIAVVIADGNRVGTAGIETGRLPAQSGVSPVAAAQLPIGAAVTIDTSSAALLEGPLVIDAVASLSLDLVLAATADEFNGKLLEIIAGPGTGLQQFIVDTTDQGGGIARVTFAAEWATAPTTASVVRIVDVEASAAAAAETFGVAVATPFTASRTGYAVTIDAAGNTAIDYTNPLVVRYDVGCPLPPNHYILGGTVREEGTGSDAANFPLTLVGFKNRLDANGEYVARIENNRLFLDGDRDDWQGVESIDLRFVPIAPDLTALTDTFLLADDADNVLEAGAAHFAALRVNGMEGVAKIDLEDLRAAKLEAEAEWLRSLSQQKRNRRGVIRDSYYSRG